MLVTGGARYAESTIIKLVKEASVELLNMDGSFVCKMHSLPEGRQDHTQNGLITCGGWTGENAKNCLTFSIGMEEWKISHTLTEERYRHSSWASPDGVVLLGGDENKNTTEILTNSGDTTTGFKLKYEIE